MAFLMSLLPKILGAILAENFSYKSGDLDMRPNSSSSSAVNTRDTPRPLTPPASTSSPTTRRYGVRSATAFGVEPPRLLEKVEKMPVAMIFAPGTTLPHSARSTDKSMCRGSSPTGTISGASCNLIVWASTNRHRSCKITKGSTLHFKLGSTLGASHCRGKTNPPNPDDTRMVFTARQSRHMRCRCVTRDDGTDVLMTIPGMRTSRDMFSACKSRIAIKFAEDRSVT